MKWWFYFAFLSILHVTAEASAPTRTETRKLNSRCQATMRHLEGEALEDLKKELAAWKAVRDKIHSANKGSDQAEMTRLKEQRDTLAKSLARSCEPQQQ